MKIKPSLFLLLAVACRLPAQIEVVSDGKVGIGTSTPGASLDVQIPGNTLGVRIQNDGATTARLLAVSAGNAGWSNGNGVAQFTVGSISSTGRAVSIVNNGTGDSLYIDHTASSGNSLIVTGGKVGLGTTNPLSKLHVMGIGRFGLNDGGNNNIGGILIASGTGVGGARQYWIGASNPTSHNNNMFQISDYNGTTNSPLLTIYGSHAGSSTGFVGIGTTSPGYKLHVAGSVRATSFISDTYTYADFVFKPDYVLPPLSEVEAHIRNRGHLPGIPSEAEVKERGIDLAAMQVKLLQKIEELTLHQIAQEKRIQLLEQQNASLKDRR